MAGAIGLFATTLTLTMGVLTVLFCSLVAVRARRGAAIDLALPLSMLSFVGTGVGIWLGVSSSVAGLPTASPALLTEAVAACAIPALALGLLLVRRISLRQLGEWGWITLIAASVIASLVGLDESLLEALHWHQCK